MLVRRAEDLSLPDLSSTAEYTYTVSFLPGSTCVPKFELVKKITYIVDWKNDLDPRTFSGQLGFTVPPQRVVRAGHARAKALLGVVSNSIHQ